MITVESDRTLASIVRVNRILPIEGADRIVLAEIKGWKCIVTITEGFQPGSLGVYFEIGSVVDKDDPTFAFLNGKFRIKTMKIRGVLSQGLLLPLSCLSARGHDISNLAEGDDVTEKMGVRKYVETEEMAQYGENSQIKKKQFTNYCPKTDEPRLQNNKHFLSEIANRIIVITRKEDGSSGTFVHKDGDFIMCSRNCTLEEPSTDTTQYFYVRDKFEIERKMRELNMNIAIQGEVVGPKLNGNRMKLAEYDFRVFNIYDIDKQEYMNWPDVVNLCQKMELHTVPVLYEGHANAFNLSVDAFLDFANSQLYVYEKDPKKCVLAEGIVVKTIDNNVETGLKRISFKVISNEYLLKHDL